MSEHRNPAHTAYAAWTEQGVRQTHSTRGHAKPHAMWLAEQWARANLHGVAYRVFYVAVM